MVQRMSTAINNVKRICCICWLMTMFHATVQAQPVHDVTVQQELSPETRMRAAANVDSVAIVTAASAPFSGKLSASAASLQKKFKAFDTLGNNGKYDLILAVDVPDNRRPLKVLYKNEPGHVFLILRKTDTVTGKTAEIAWGYYPANPVAILFFRRSKSQLLINAKREYNASLTVSLSAAQAAAVAQNALRLSAKKYHLNKYNCYDYAIELYNTIEGAVQLLNEKVKYPFVFGKGGSPCGLYRQLQKIKNSERNDAILVSFGLFTSQ
jgi:hypothetical protein